MGDSILLFMFTPPQHILSVKKSPTTLTLMSNPQPQCLIVDFIHANSHIFCTLNPPPLDHPFRLCLDVHPPETHRDTLCPLAASLSASVKTAELAQAWGINVCIPVKWAMMIKRWADAGRVHQCAAPVVFGFSELCGSGRRCLWERWYEPHWALYCAREHHEMRKASLDELLLHRHLWEPCRLYKRVSKGVNHAIHFWLICA